MPAEPASDDQKPFWLARSTRTIFFFAAILTVAGIYLAFQVPISVFPDTNFPRVIIGVDNGVMPVEQMEVTITQPHRKCHQLGSGTYIGAFHHQPRLGRGGPVLQLERGHGALAAVGEFGAGAGAAGIAIHGPHHHQPPHLCDLPHSWLQSHLRHRSRDAALGDRHLRPEASAEPRRRRELRGRAGRASAGVCRGAQPGAARKPRERPSPTL